MQDTESRSTRQWLVANKLIKFYVALSTWPFAYCRDKQTNTTEGTTKAAPCQLSAGTECRQLQLIDYIDEWISNKTPTQRGVWMRYRVCIPSACWGLTLSLHFHLHLRTYISIHLCAMLWLQYARLVNLFLSSCLLNKFLVKCLRSISLSVTFPVPCSVHVHVHVPHRLSFVSCLGPSGLRL